MKIELFKNEKFGEIRGLLIDNEPWFVGRDVAKVLGYSNVSKAVIVHIDDEDKNTINLPQSQNGNMVSKTTIINESGLYSLILTSKLPKAKEFKRWVTSEVLPSIRKHGGYIANQENLSPEEIIAKALIVAKSVIEKKDRLNKELQFENNKLSKDNEVMKPKADYFDDLVDRNLLTSIRDTAKELQVKEKVFVQFLLERKYLYRDKKGKLMPYSATNDGLFELKEVKSDNSKWVGIQTLVAPKGRETFRLLVK